ncbi:MAG: hypothetical protein HNEKOMLI_00649 [Sodalis sp. Psp]|nr:hypothetical protein [Sodalis sp. Psp]MCR3757117.1 hypothetical protein [Sodalis sp. Ppy]
MTPKIIYEKKDTKSNKKSVRLSKLLFISKSYLLIKCQINDNLVFIKIASMLLSSANILKYFIFNKISENNSYYLELFNSNYYIIN